MSNSKNSSEMLPICIACISPVSISGLSVDCKRIERGAEFCESIHLDESVKFNSPKTK